MEKVYESDNVCLFFNPETKTKAGVVPRLQLFCDAQKSPSAWKHLNEHGWHWSPSNKAWQRAKTVNAVLSAREIILLFEDGADVSPLNAYATAVKNEKYGISVSSENGEIAKGQSEAVYTAGKATFLDDIFFQANKFPIINLLPFLKPAKAAQTWMPKLYEEWLLERSFCPPFCSKDKLWYFFAETEKGDFAIYKLMLEQLAAVLAYYRTKCEAERNAKYKIFPPAKGTLRYNEFCAFHRSVCGCEYYAIAVQENFGKLYRAIQKFLEFYNSIH